MRHQSTRKKRPSRKKQPLRFPPLLLVLGAAALCLWGLCSLSFHFSASKKPPQRSPVKPAVQNLTFCSSLGEAETGETVSQVPKEEEIRKKLSRLQETFPQGAYWNHTEGEADDPFTTTGIPCEHAVLGDAYCHHYSGATQAFFPCYEPLSQCLAFASFLSDQLFGEDAPIFLHRSFSQLKSGDHIRLTGEEHSMIVVEKAPGSVTVAEVNSDYEHCQISWNRTVSREELEALGEEVEYLTRYPQNPAEP